MENECLLANIGLNTEENEPLKVRESFAYPFRNWNLSRSFIRRTFFSAAATAEPVAEDHENEEPLLEAEDDQDHEDHDDFVGNLMIDTYVRDRVNPLLQHYIYRASILANRYYFLQFVLAALGTTSTIMAAVHLKRWIPVMVGLTTAVNAVQQELRLMPTLQAANDAIAAIQQSLVLWNRQIGLKMRRTNSIDH